jgi:uncharacterized membrane protein
VQPGEERKEVAVKKYITLLVCLAATLALTGVVLAQTNPESQIMRDKSQVPTKKKVRGTVVSVDPGDYSIVVKSKGATIKFEVDEATTIKVDTKDCQLSDVPTDARITVLYKRHGNKKLAVWLMAETKAQPGIGKQVTRPVED